MSELQTQGSDLFTLRARVSSIRERLQHILNILHDSDGSESTPVVRKQRSRSTLVKKQNTRSALMKKRRTNSTRVKKQSTNAVSRKSESDDDFILTIEEREIDSADDSVQMEPIYLPQHEDKSPGEDCNSRQSSARVTNPMKRKYPESDGSKSSTGSEFGDEIEPENEDGTPEQGAAMEISSSEDEDQHENKDSGQEQDTVMKNSSSENRSGDFDFNLILQCNYQKKNDRVGKAYQATTSEGPCEKDDRLSSSWNGHEEDQLLWDPRRLTGEETEHYLKTVFEMKCSIKSIESAQSRTSEKSDSTQRCTVVLPNRDEERALYLLLMSDFNVKEALFRVEEILKNEKSTVWSPKESDDFERGIYFFGRNFYQIHLNHVPTKSVSDIVEFYYAWKQTPQYGPVIKAHKRTLRRSDHDRYKYLIQSTSDESSESSDDD